MRTCGKNRPVHQWVWLKELFSTRPIRLVTEETQYLCKEANFICYPICSTFDLIWSPIQTHETVSWTMSFLGKHCTLNSSSNITFNSNFKTVSIPYIIYIMHLITKTIYNYCSTCIKTILFMFEYLMSTVWLCSSKCAGWKTTKFMHIFCNLGKTIQLQQCHGVEMPLETTSSMLLGPI